jgi:hypothetical protein
MNTPRFVPVQARPPGRGKWVASGVAIAIAVAGFALLPRCYNRVTYGRWRAKNAERAAMLTHWVGWVEAGSCMRHDDSARWFPSGATAGDTPDTPAMYPYVDPKCVRELTSLLDDPALPTSAKQVIRDWLDADRVIGDGTAASDAVKAQLVARDQVRDRVRKDVIPVIREQIRKTQHLHDDQHDYIWWQIELGFQLEDILDRGREAHSAGRDVSAAVDTAVHKLIDDMRSADRTVGVRELSSLSVLAHSTGAAAWPALKAVEDNAIWDNLESDNSVFGPMPPEPQGCDVSLPGGEPAVTH